MKTRTILSLFIATLTIFAAVFLYMYIFKSFETIWFDFKAIFLLCVVTFGAGCGLYISAILIEKHKS